MEAAAGSVAGRPPPATTGGAATGGEPSALRAAAAALVFVAFTAVETRMGDEWGTGIFLVLNTVGAVITFGWALQAAGAPVPGAASGPSPGRLPGGVTTALLVIGLSFVLSMIINFAQILGAEGGPGSVTWTALLFAAVAGYAGWSLGSPVSALFSSAALGVAFLALVQWLFEPESAATFRWLLLVLAIAYAAVAFRLDTAFPRHAVQHVSAAGLALIALLGTLYLELIEPFFELLAGGGEVDPLNAAVGWELVGLAGAGAVVAYAVVRREPGPGYVGGLALALAALTAALPESEASLVGWPLLLLLAAAAAVAAVVKTEGVP